MQITKEPVLVNGSPVHYDKVPVGYMTQAVEYYVEHGIQPGGFLSAVLRNDFIEAVGRADEENGIHLRDWGVFLYNYLPVGSYGSQENFSNWIKKER